MITGSPALLSTQRDGRVVVNNRYAILRKLGEGGSGEVYLTEDLLRDSQLYAVKILHPHGDRFPLPTEILHNEVSILVGLHHPNLIRVFDFGLVMDSKDQHLMGRRYIAMEYTEGVNLQTWYASLSTQEERERELRDVILQVLLALQFIHHSGVIHYDIKPENLLVTPGEAQGPPMVKLMDFGFSRHCDDQAGLCVRGTFEYTAPELLGGGLHDHRVDLYSLGVTLFQVLEGRCPFVADRPVELIKKILNDPITFSAMAVGPLRVFVETLLRRSPDDRYPDALTAATALARGEHEETITELHRDFKPAFAGRRSELSRIIPVLHSLAPQGAGETLEQLVLIDVVGSEGSGKTAFLQELTTSARKKDIPVFGVEGFDQAMPLHSVTTVLKHLQAWALSLAPASRMVAESSAPLLKDFFSTHGGATTHREQLTETMADGIAQFVLECSMVFPFVITLDDMDVMDAESHDVFDRILAGAAPGCLLIIGTWTDPPMRDGLQHATRIVFRDLDVQDVISLSRSLFGPTVFADELGTFLHSQYGGVPAVLVEALQAILSLRPEVTEEKPEIIRKYLRTLSTRLPLNIDQFALRRFRTLKREQQIILEFLACFRRPARVEILESLLPYHKLRGRHHRMMLEALGYLARSEGSPYCSIRQNRLRSVVYTLLADSRKELHAYIANAMENTGAVVSLEDMEELAFQLREGHDFDRASVQYERASHEAMRCSAPRQAVRLLQKAIDCSPVGSNVGRAIHLRHELASAQLQAGSYADAITTVTELRDAAGATHPGLMKILGLAQSRTGLYEEAKLSLQQALREAGSEIENLEIRVELAGIEIALGNFQDAEAECRLQMEQATRVGDRLIIASVCTDLGIATFFQQRYDEATEYFTRSIEIYSSSGERLKLIDALCNIGNALSAKGDFAAAILHWNEALEKSREYGTLNQQAQMLNNLGIAHFSLKEFERAAAFYADAHEIARRAHSRNLEAFTLTNLSELTFADGAYEQSLQHSTEGLALYEQMDDGQGIAESLIQLAEVFLLLGDIVSVEQHLEKARNLIGSRRLDALVPPVQLLAALVAIEKREHAQAFSLLEQAEKEFRAGGEESKAAFCGIRRMACMHMLGQTDQAISAGRALAVDPSLHKEPSLAAELMYLLGSIAQHSDDGILEKPVVYFRKGLEAITREPVSELTWKLSYALGVAYGERGLRGKAAEYFEKTRMILRYFVDRFSSDAFKELYLQHDDRGKVLDAISSHMSAVRASRP